MRPVLLASALCLIAPSLALSQPIVQTVKKDGKQVITEIEQVEPPPPVKGQPDAGKGTASSVVFKANNWKCGREFTDEKGRRWRMTAGTPYASPPPAALSGWHIVTEDGRNSFYTTGGKLFAQVN